eukprot:scaffold584_cov132-Cylindrotheca_fusiformis.AAC.39
MGEGVVSRTLNRGFDPLRFLSAISYTPVKMFEQHKPSMTSYYHFNEEVFRSDVAKALKGVEQILEVHRHPQLAEDVDHEYVNKYELANRMVNTSIIAQMNCLERMGLTSEVLKEMDTSKSTTLRFQASEKCSFLKEQNVDVPSDRSYETEEESKSSSTFFGNTKTTTVHRMVKK